MTTAPRSSTRRSAGRAWPARVSTSRPSSSDPVATGTDDWLGANGFDISVGPCSSTVPPSTIGQFGGHLGHPAAAQHQLGEPVVGDHGQLGVPALFPQRGVGLLETDERGTGLGQQPGVVQGHRGVRGQRGQQGDLVAGERSAAPVGGEQHADHLGAPLERHAQDGHQPPSECTAESMVPRCWKRSSVK